MDTGTLLVGGLLLAILLIPFIYAIRHQKRKNQNEKERFIALAETNNLTLSKSEIINELNIGLDEGQNKLAVSRKSTLEKDFQVIDLNTCTSCEVKTQTSEYVKVLLHGNKKTYELLLWEKPDEFFPETDFTTSKVIADKWVARLTSILKAS